MKVIFFTIALASIMGCQKHGESGDKFVPIAAVGGMDFATQDEISSLLKTSNIECFFEGSVLYGLQVRKKDAGMAIRILEKSEELSGRITWSSEAKNQLQSR